MPKNTSVSSTNADHSSGSSHPAMAGSGSAPPIAAAMSEHMAAIQRMHMMAAPLSSGIADPAMFPAPLINDDGTLPTMEQIQQHHDAFQNRVRSEIEATHQRMVQEAQALGRIQGAPGQLQQHQGGLLADHGGDGNTHFYSSETVVRADGDGNVVRHTIVNKDGEVEEHTDTIQGQGKEGQQRLLQ